MKMRARVLHVLSSFPQRMLEPIFFEMAVSLYRGASKALSDFVEQTLGLPILDIKNEKDIHFVVLILCDFGVNLLP